MPKTNVFVGLYQNSGVSSCGDYKIFKNFEKTEQLMRQAKRLEISGRSSMNKEKLIKAIYRKI
jgi:hypothetical protein